jgi:hypothetical protein
MQLGWDGKQLLTTLASLWGWSYYVLFLRSGPGYVVPRRIKLRGLVMTKLECDCFIVRERYLGLYLQKIQDKKSQHNLRHVNTHVASYAIQYLQHPFRAKHVSSTWLQHWCFAQGTTLILDSVHRLFVQKTLKKEQNSGFTPCSNNKLATSGWTSKHGTLNPRQQTLRVRIIWNIWLQ